jgi:hypothetical protein
VVVFSVVPEKWKEIKREYFYICMNYGPLQIHENNSKMIFCHILPELRMYEVKYIDNFNMEWHTQRRTSYLNFEMPE